MGETMNLKIKIHANSNCGSYILLSMLVAQYLQLRHKPLLVSIYPLFRIMLLASLMPL
ncbi:hypothetical protein KCTC52924_03324 [Arenibacter antarcticus]